MQPRKLQPRKRLRGLTIALAVTSLLVLPSVASAQWRSNGVVVGSGGVAGITKQPVAQFGTLTLGNSFVGEWKCGVLAGVPVWNEGDNGFASVEAAKPVL